MEGSPEQQALRARPATAERSPAPAPAEPPRHPGDVGWAGLQELVARAVRQLVVTPAAAFDETIGRCLAEIGATLGVDRAFIATFDQGRGVLYRSHVWQRESLGSVPTHHVPGLDELEWSIARLRQGLVLEVEHLGGLPPEADAERAFFRRRGTFAAVWVPIVVDGTVEGVFAVETVARRVRWHPSMVAALRIVADLCGGALSRRKVELEVVHRARLERGVARGVHGLLTRPADPVERVVLESLGEIAAAAGAQRAHVYVHDPRRDALDRIAEWCAPGTTPAWRGRAGIAVSEMESWSDQLQQGTVVVIDDVLDLPEGAEHREFLLADDVASLLAAPVLIDGHVAGVVSFSAVTTPVRWSEPVRVMFPMLGEAIGGALGRSRAHAELARQAELLAVHNEELEATNTALEEFVAVAAHDLKGPLVAEHGLLLMLQRSKREQLDPEARQLIDRATANAVRMVDIVDGHLRMATTPVCHERVSVDIGAVLDGVLSVLDTTLSEVGATVVAEPMPEVAADAGLVQQVFLNLLSNSVRYRRPDRPLGVAVAAVRVDEVWRIDFSDNGIGIPAAEQAVVFDKRLPMATSGRGLGLGLRICRRAVEALGGRIWVRESSPEGTTISFTLPSR